MGVAAEIHREGYATQLPCGIIHRQSCTPFGPATSDILQPSQSHSSMQSVPSGSPRPSVDRRMPRSYVIGLRQPYVLSLQLLWLHRSIYFPLMSRLQSRCIALCRRLVDRSDVQHESSAVSGRGRIVNVRLYKPGIYGLVSNLAVRYSD